METVGFESIQDMPIVDPNAPGRTLARNQISQFTEITGQNKSIIMSDGTNARVLIGYSKGGF